MNEQKHELPAAMVDAAAKAIRDYQRRLEFADDFSDSSAAEAALRAAGVPDLAARIAELEAALTLAIPRMEHLQSLLGCGESVQFCNEFDEQKGKDVAEEVEQLKRIMQK